MAASRVPPKFVTQVYAPIAIFILATAVAKPEFVPYAIAFATVPIALTGVLWYLGLEAGKAGRSKATAASTVLHPNEFRHFPLAEKIQTSHNTAIYRFRLPKPTDVLGLPIGQHISLAAMDPTIEKPIVRSYTPISSDETQGHFDLMIKSYPTGNVSKHVGELSVGQTMNVKGPKGAMTYSPNMCRHIGMIAGGTGITPMLQIARAIIRGRPQKGGSDKTRVDLIFANVNEDDILLREELDQLAQEDANFNVYYVLNNAPEQWDGGVGFVTADMIKSKLPAPAQDMKILICGPPPMVSAMKKATESLGYERVRPVSKLADQVFCF